MADLDLRPARRERMAGELCGTLGAAILGSRVGFRGSLASSTADRYSDIDLCWVVPGGMLTEAVYAVPDALRSVGAVSSIRTDPGFARSNRRRLLFIRLAGVPLFWRVDLDVRDTSVAADESYDASNPAARSEEGWSRPASAIENAIAAIKAAARGHRSDADDLLSRGFGRIGLDPEPSEELPGRIVRLADSCASLDADLVATAAEVRDVVAAFEHARLLS